MKFLLLYVEEQLLQQEFLFQGVLFLEESFDDRDFEPNEEFNVYLVARRYSIDETSLNDLIKETAEQILNYTDFEEEHY